MPRAITAGIVGASGFTGGELCRLLLGHKHVERILPTSRGTEPFEQVHRNLLGSGLAFIDIEQLTERMRELDVVFFCTPTGEAMRQVPAFLEGGVRIVDLSPDFRFARPEHFRKVYGADHASAFLLGDSVYGVTEFYRDEIRDARLVANPGCYVIAALLGLAPLLNDSRMDLTRRIAIHATNGTTGAGNTPKPAIMHAAVANSVLPYSMEGHRHGPEMEDQLSKLAGRAISVDFNAAHGSFPRGIYLQASVEVADDERRSMSRDVILELYRSFYERTPRREPFVLINSFPKRGAKNEKEYHVYPAVCAVTGSNYCHLGIDFDADRGLVKVISVIDNLVKGAGGSAIQNMNVMFDFDEREGLRHFGL